MKGRGLIFKSRESIILPLHACVCGFVCVHELSSGTDHMAPLPVLLSQFGRCQNRKKTFQQAMWYNCSQFVATETQNTEEMCGWLIIQFSHLYFTQSCLVKQPKSHIGKMCPTQ